MVVFHNCVKHDGAQQLQEHSDKPQACWMNQTDLLLSVMVVLPNHQSVSIGQQNGRSTMTPLS